MKKYVFFSKIFFCMFNVLHAIELPIKVDFEISLGKDHKILSEFYNEFFQASNLCEKHRKKKKNRGIECDLAARPHSIIKLKNNLKKMYEESWIDFNQLANVSSYKIPKIIHQIWLGPKTPPENFAKWQSTWKNLPGWTYVLWTDEDLRKLNLVNQGIINAEPNWGAKSDILRYELLYLFGGLYIDIDFECLNPDVLDLFNKTYDFYTGILPIDSAVLALTNAFIASSKHNPIMANMVQWISANYSNDPDTPVYLRAGPVPFTRVFWKFMRENPELKVMVLPPTYLFPKTMSDKKTDSYPESIASHYWAASWV